MKHNWSKEQHNYHNVWAKKHSIFGDFMSVIFSSLIMNALCWIPASLSVKMVYWPHLTWYGYSKYQGMWKTHTHICFRQIDSKRHLVLVNCLSLLIVSPSLHLCYSDIQHIVSTVESTGLHLCENEHVEYALAVYVHPYPNVVLSVWLYAASPHSKIILSRSPLIHLSRIYWLCGCTHTL